MSVVCAHVCLGIFFVVEASARRGLFERGEGERRGEKERGSDRRDSRHTNCGSVSVFRCFSVRLLAFVLKGGGFFCSFLFGRRVSCFFFNIASKQV